MAKKGTDARVEDMGEATESLTGAYARTTVSFRPEVMAMLDALGERSGLDRTAVLAYLIVTMTKHPVGPFVPAEMPPDVENRLVAWKERAGRG